MIMMERQSTIPTTILERNNEAVYLIQDRQFEKANVILVDALRALRSDPVSESGPSEGKEASSCCILSLDQWMVSPSEALHHRIPETATDSFFVYNSGIRIPTDFFQRAYTRYCPVDSTAAVASAMFFNQGLACHLLYIQKSSLPQNPCNDASRIDSLQQATDLYRIAIQSSRHMQKSISLDSTRRVNANFFLAAINNLAVSDRVHLILTQQQRSNGNSSSSSNDHPRRVPNFDSNKYFESLRSFLSQHRPDTKNSPEEQLWNRYVANSLKGNDMIQPSFCASAC